MANRLTLRDEIKRIQAEFGSTILYITHDQEEAFALSDRIMVMENGRIHQLDTPGKHYRASGGRVRGGICPSQSPEENRFPSEISESLKPIFKKEG